MSIPLFTVFLDVLNKLRGEFFHKINNLISQHIYDIFYKKDLNWKYKFEKIDKKIPKKKLFSFPGFIHFCQLE
jgi:hypothetical protein